MREHMSIVLRRLQGRRFVEFQDLFDPDRGIAVLVVTFIALLELSREQPARGDAGRGLRADLRAAGVHAQLSPRAAIRRRAPCLPPQGCPGWQCSSNPLTYALMDAFTHSHGTVATDGAGLAPLASLVFVGQGLVRPECVLANAAGDLFTADWRGGVAHLRADGGQVLYAGPGPDGLALKPNGIALLRDGSFLLTHLGNDDGGVFHLQRSGQVAPWLLQVDGVDLPPTNFVVEDKQGRFWVTVSTRLKPRALGYRRSCDDGFIVRVDARGAAIVADGLGYTNEVAVHPSGQWLYVNETFARRLSRFALHDDGSLGAKEVVTEFGARNLPRRPGFR